MNQQGAHSYEDKLLEFAYGELPSAEARSVEAHVKGCARCAGALDSIRGVRRTMATLEPEPAPDAGLESLLAYAGQAARRIQAGPAPSHARLRRWIFSLAGVASLVVLGIVALQVVPEVNPLAQKEKALAEQRREQNAAAVTAAAPEPMPPPAPVAQATPQVAAEEGQQGPAEDPAAHATRMDKLADMRNATEGGRSTFPSAGAPVERKGADLNDGLAKNKAPSAAYVPPQAQLSSRGALDTRDYSQRYSKPVAVRSKKAAAKSDLESSGWEPLQFKEGAGGTAGRTGDQGLKERDAKQQAAPADEPAKKENEASRRVLSLQNQSKDAYAQAAPPAEEESSDDFDALMGRAENRAPAGPAPAQSAPEASGGEIATREPATQPTSTGADARQQVAAKPLTVSSSIARPPEPKPVEKELARDRERVNPLRSRQQKLRAEIDATTERSKLIGLYSDLCDVELELGLYQPESCQHIVQNFFGTNAAIFARSRLESQRQAYEQRMLDEERAKKAVEAAPAAKQ